MEVVFFQKNVRKLYNEKYKAKYSNWNYVFDRDYIKDTRIRRVHSGRKRKATGFVYLKGSPYRDADGSSQLRSCRHDEIINTAPRIGGHWIFLILSPVSTQKGEGNTHERVGKNINVYHL